MKHPPTCVRVKPSPRHMRDVENAAHYTIVAAFLNVHCCKHDSTFAIFRQAKRKAPEYLELSSGDYHGEVNVEHYETWFSQKLLPQLPPGSVVVMEAGQRPRMSSLRKDIQSSYVAELTKLVDSLDPLVWQGIKEVTAEKWKSYVEHALNQEDGMTKLDHIISDVVNHGLALVINVEDELFMSSADSTNNDDEM
ncbi:hypothetical protein HPB50_017268 [Hyalomma asiaticum]|uniref:Uncharacterized protein n=1 Tax=Hyalomma asiaticum TaxID=266040 RepID=A0ACB7SWK7_HYAAI|nr:hypothetical protein HPB50_017268 [Hyalomma asiaticum]